MHVPFATNQDQTNAFVSKAGGFSGFPGEINNADNADPGIGPGTIYPIKISLLDAVYAYWKVKTWSVDYSATGPMSLNIHDTFTTEAQRFGTGDSPLEKTRDLVFGAGWFDQRNDPNPEFLFLLFNPEPIGNFPSSVQDSDKKMIYPQTLFELGSDWGTYSTGSAAGNLYFMGYSFPIYSSIPAITGGYINVQVSEEWDYDT